MNSIIKICNEASCPTGKRHANPASCGHSILFALEIICAHGQDAKLIEQKLHDVETRYASKK